ncbi:MAG: CotH kinase family protein, partial [Clostridia bacterium]|nr:CotH kinase family protein [Clostridia bacterium]
GSSIIFRQVYATGSNNDTPVRYSFLELYNKSGHSIPLGGKSLQYAKGEKTEYIPYPFPEDAVIPGHSSYLIRCAEAVNPKGDAYLDACEAFSLNLFDMDIPSLSLSSKATRLILADTVKSVSASSVRALYENAHVLACFSACSEDSDTDFPAVSRSLDKRTAIRRTDDLSGWEAVDYAHLPCDVITAYTPSASSGQNTEIPISNICVQFSVPGGRYDKTVEVELSTMPGYEIVYTFEHFTSPKRFDAYKKPLKIKDTTVSTYGFTAELLMDKYGTDVKPRSVDTPSGMVLKACAFDGENYGPVCTQTYFVLPDMAHYDDIPILNFTVNPYDFTGDRGIYSIVSDNIFAERKKLDGYLEIYDEKTGNPEPRYVQLAMSGNGSLAFKQKSMRVYIREEDTPESAGTLYYDLFAGDAVDKNGEPITTIKTFLMRNSGNDAGCSHLRDTFMQHISASLNVDIQAYRPAMVFFNGEFWGMYNLRERYDTAYFVNHYGVDEQNLVMLESPSPLLTGNNSSPYTVNEGLPGDDRDFMEIMSFSATHKKMTDEDVAWVEERMDLDNFTDFFLANLYLCNTDWPGNNIKVWRNKNPDDPSGLDTRWRWVLSDMDFGVGYGTDASQNMFAHALTEDSYCGRLMKHLLTNKTFSQRFIDRAIYICNELYQPETVLPVLTQMKERIEPYIERNFLRWRGDGGSMERFERHIGKITTFMNDRGAVFARGLKSATGTYVRT